LIILLSAKDKKAFEYLYDNYSASLFGVIVRIVKSDDTAEEIMQDAFLKYWTRFGEYDPEKGKLFTWLVNIARNIAIDKIRSKEFKQSSKTDGIVENVSISDASYSERNKPEFIGVREMLNVLSAEQKELLELMYFKGYTQSEISEEYNIPLGTVKTRVRSAISRLRGMF
jgi:RNA polymerase sigma-70 factor (ECF subfamily)